MKRFIRILGVITLLAGMSAVVYATVFSVTYDTATPLGTDAPSTLDNQIRNLKSANQERNDVDHYWPLTGTQVSDVAVGEHRKISFNAPISHPTYGANKAFLYPANANSVIELWWLDELNNFIQITSYYFIIHFRSPFCFV